MSTVTTEGNVVLFNSHRLFTFDEAYDQAGADNVIEYHGCRLLRDFDTPRRASTFSRHNERACRRGSELHVIECDARGNLLGFDDANTLQLDYTHEDLMTCFPSPSTKT